MRKKLIIIFILLGILTLLIKINFINDQKVYTLNEYGPNGKLIGTNEYILRDGDTVMNGKFVNYNEKGIKVSEGKFINNEPYGVCSYYDDNGKIEAIYFRKNSKINLECKYYNKKGLLEKYIMCDDLGKTAFVIHFDEKGVTKYDGHFQIETYQYNYANKAKFNIAKDQYLRVGDTLNYSYLVANIPNAKRSFTIENLSDSHSKRTTKKTEPCQIDVKEVLTKKGKNTIRSIVTYKFDDGITPVFKDTLSFDVNLN